jgi:hypothetical protein
MQRGSIGIGKFSWGLLACTCFCVLSFVLCCGDLPSAVAEGSIKTTIKVCAVDEEGKAVDIQPTLFNSPAKLNLKDGNCYKAVGVQLDSKQMYFVAAANQDRTSFAFAPLIVQPEDDGQEKVILLKLERNTGPVTPTIEICLSDENGAPLSIKEIKHPSDSKIVKDENKPLEDCSRLSVALANEYKFALTVGGVKTNPDQQNSNRLVNAALLFLAVASCVLTAFVLIRLNQLPLNIATQETVGSLSNTVAEVKQETEQILDSIPQVCSFKQPETPSAEGQSVPTGNETGAGARQDAHEQSPVSQPAPEPPATAPSTIVDRQDRSRGDAKQRYRSFSQGQSVEHFFVMPSGASSASGMVEDVGVELREQNSGAYVAFHSIENQDGAWAFPMPGTHFTSESFRSLFPDLTAEQYEIGDIEPRALVLLEPKLWKLSS